jgi:predicted nucleotide-binding protein (sugar kinase/HSP70/actin superfamily)
VADKIKKFFEIQIDQWAKRLKDKNRTDRFRKIYQQMMSLNSEELKDNKLFSEFLNYKLNKNLKSDLQKELDEVIDEVQFVEDLSSKDKCVNYFRVIIDLLRAPPPQ